MQRRTRPNPRIAAFVVTAVLLTTSSAEKPTPPVGVTARIKPDKPLCLQMVLRTGNAKPGELYKYRLPWGNYNNMVLAGATPKHEYLKRAHPIDDPPPGQIVPVRPHSVLEGEYCLRYVFPELEATVKKSDVFVFWAYEAPEELAVPKWSGGWVVIPRQH